MFDRTLFLPGPAGQLEARLRGGDFLQPRAVGLLLPPHPLHGGTLHNKLLFRIAKRLGAELGMPTLRCNFRGVGASQGQYDHGLGERDDAAAALAWLRGSWPLAPTVAIGYSFGAVVGLAQLTQNANLRCFVAIGLPLEFTFDASWIRAVDIPGCFVQGELDGFTDCRRLGDFLSHCGRAEELRCIPGADHYFQGCEDAAVEEVVRYIGQVF